MSELDAAQRDRLAILVEVARDDPAEFDRDVSSYVHNPQPGEEAVFRHRDLLRHTADSVRRLLTVEKQTAAAAAKGSPERARRVRRHEALGREDRALRPLLRELEATSSIAVRRRAERILGKVMYTELRAVMSDLKGGATETRAEAALRERLRERGGK